MKIGKHHENLVLTLCAVILAVLGCIMVFSATSVTAGASARYGHDSAYFFKRQVLFLVLGASAGMFLSRVDYDIYRRRIFQGLCGVFVLLLLVYIPGVGHKVNGSLRWISLRLFNFQPSEVAKFVLLMFAAWSAERAGERPDSPLRAYLPAMAVLGVFSAAIVMEPDFGMTMVICLSFMAVLFASGLPWRWLAAAGGLGAAGVVVAVLKEPYRLQRLFAFLHPMENAQGSAYQVVQSLIAFSNGGLLGAGFGGGRQKLFYLPEIHTDYIISVIGEELGFAGVTLIGACFMTFTFMGFRIARRARDPFGRYLAMGISFAIGMQALLNMMVGLSMLPPKGMVLPFLSYGGSSLIIHLAATGILVNISMKGADAFVATPDDRRRRDRWARVSGDSDR